MKNILVEFKNVSKTYSISRYKYRRLSESISESIGRYLSGVKDTKQETFWALKNVSLKIYEGDSVGIIGRNGSGKTTILKLISKITYPNNGKINFYGKRIGAFIELGAGLHPDLSGRENIYLYGSILGMTRKEISQKLDQIVDFSEIHKFLDTPIKRYSSGMYARLGFSVCAFCDPDILLVDEVLAVGDLNFQKKCIDKMHSIAKEKTVIFVSHNLDAVKSICTKVIYLDQGRIIKFGKSNNVVENYLERSKGMIHSL